VNWRVNQKPKGTTTMQANAIQAALKREGASEDQIKIALHALGLDLRAAVPAEKSTKMVSSETAVHAAKPGIYRVKGVRRLYLKKTSRDAGSYYLRYRIDGRRPSMGLGSIVDVTLAKAKALAEELGGRLVKKVDLLAERKAERAAEARKGTVPTVADAIQTYLAANAPAWKHVYARANWFNPIERYALPVIGRLKVDEIEPRHILAVLKATDEKGVASLGRKIRSRLKTVFDWLSAHGQRNAALGNPADAGVINAGRPKGQEKGGHYRRIDNPLDEAPSVFAKLCGLASDNAAIACWCFMALTAARPGDALAARWDEVDFAKKLWMNPVSKTGKREPLPVPLSTAAIAILEQAKHRSKSDLIFTNGGGGKLAHSNLAGAPKRAGIEAGTPHSWRSIFRDAVEDKLGFRRETAEAALGHSLGAVEGAYRRETAIEARAVMMEAYTGWLLDKSADKVIRHAFPATA
jgi:integrase